MEIAVVGPGDIGMALAADLAQRGHAVRLWGTVSDRCEAVRWAGGIRLNDRGEEATVPVKVPSGAAEAVRGVEAVLVCAPAYRQEVATAAIAPHLEDDQAVVFMPGNLNEPRAMAAFGRAGGRPAVAGVAVPPVAARRSGDNQVVIILRARHVPIAGCPAADRRAVTTFSSLYPVCETERDVLAVFLQNPTYVIHSALTVTNAGAIEHFYPDPGFDVQAQGTTDATRRVVDALDSERIALRQRLDYTPPHYRQATSYYTDEEDGLFGKAALDVRDLIARYKQPMNLDHRYVKEDLAVNLPTLRWVASVAGTPVPVVDALVTLGGTLVGRRLDGDGRTADLPTDLADLRSVLAG